MVNAKQWLDRRYPKNQREKIEKLNISDRGLEGDLDLSDFINLKELDCNNNKLTNFHFADKKNLIKLDIRDNLFLHQDLFLFSEFTNLESLKIGRKRVNLAYAIETFWNHQSRHFNSFGSSLKFLKDMSRLKELSIINTDIDGGLEFLPNSLEEIRCGTTIMRSRAYKCDEICEKLRNFRKGNNHYNLVKWREENMKKKDNFEPEIKESEENKRTSEETEEEHEKKKLLEIRKNLLSLYLQLEAKEKELRSLSSQKNSEQLNDEINKLKIEINSNKKISENLKEWKGKGFSYSDREKWLEAGLESEDVDYARWLQDEIGITAQYILNYSNEQSLWGKLGGGFGYEINTRRKPCIDWEKSYPEFTSSLKNEWKERNFSDEEIERWIKVGLKTNDVDFADYLRNKRGRTPEWCFHHGDVEELRENYNAYKDLGLEISCLSKEDSKEICRERNKWHPDKWMTKTPEERKNAEEKFKRLQKVVENSCDKKGGDWRNIHRDFTVGLREKWGNKDFKHKEVENWVKSWVKSSGGQLHPSDYDLFDDIVKKGGKCSNPNWWADFCLEWEERELNEKYPDYSKISYSNVQEWFNNSFPKETNAIFANEKNLEGELTFSGKDLCSLSYYPLFTKGFENLEVVDISGNEGLTNINLVSLPQLVIFNSNNCQIVDIKINNCPNISELSVGGNKLKELDVSSLIKLTLLQCSHNQLTELDLRNNPELARLFCEGNQIANLYLNKNSKLDRFNLEGVGINSGGIMENVLVCREDVILERTEGAHKAGKLVSNEVIEIPASSLLEFKNNEESYQNKEIDYEKIRPINSFEWKINKDRRLTKKELPTKLYNINKYNSEEILVSNIIKESVENTKDNLDIKSYTTLSYVCGPYECKCENDCYECKDYIYKGLKKSLSKAIKALEVINKEKDEKSKINYLWIDQLCIDQNNKIEKAHEVRHMHKNYDNSAITLIAIHSNATEEDKSPLDLPEILSRIINSKWFSRSWTFQEGWLSRQTLFMFDDMLVDGRIMAGIWVLNLNDNSAENYRTLGEFSNGTRKFSTPLGWSHYGKGYNFNDNTSLSLSQSLGGIRKRGRGVPVDGTYSILGLLPYGDEVEVEYKPWGQKHTKEELNQILTEVMIKSLRDKTGYIEPFSWHGKGQNWLPKIEDENGSTSVVEGVGFRFRSKNLNEIYKENGDIELIVHKCFVKDIVNRPRCSFSAKLNDNFLFPGSICVEFENRYRELSLENWIKIQAFTEEQHEYLENLVNDEGVKKVKSEEKYTFKYLKSLLPDNINNCQNPLPKQEEEVLVSGTYETLAKMEIGDILLVPDWNWKKWKVSKPFGVLASLTEDNYYQRKGLVNFLPKCFLDNWRELGKAEQKKIIVSLNSQNSVTVQESLEVILNQEYDTEEKFEKENGDPVMRNRGEKSVTEHAKVLKKEQVRNDWKNQVERFEFKSKDKRVFLLEASKELETNGWANIDSSFSSELTQKWIDYGFTCEQCRDWINTNSPSQHAQEIKRPDHYAWLRDIKKVDVEWVLNYGNKQELEREYFQWKGERLESQIEIYPKN